MDLWHKRNNSILELSGGEQQRVFLARALVQNTPFLMMDEPFTFLDPRQQQNMVYTLQQHKQKGSTLLVSLHDITLAKEACDELILLKNGQILQKGRTSELASKALIERLYA